MQNYKYLNNINFPSDIKKLNNEELKVLSEEVRSEMIDAVSKTGGHLGAGLGVVELTVALHHVFDTPKDKLIWDVGHQSYPHKILTGRKDKIRTLRQEVDYLVLQSDRKVNLTLLVQLIVPLLFLLDLVLQQQINYQINQIRL